MLKAGYGSFLLGLTFLAALFACNNAPSEPPCTDPVGCITIEPQDPIKIGVLQTLSGNVAPLGIEQIRGLELALEKWQKKVADHPIVLQTEDTGCTSEGGANAALRIAADPQVVAIFGTTCSGSAATAAKVMSDAGLTMISGNNSAPFLTSIDGKRGPDWQPGYFRTAANEEHSGKAAATFAYTRLGIRKAATVNDGDIYTKGLTGGFIQTFIHLGGEIVLNTSVNKGDDEMGPILTAVADSQAELLFFPLFQPEGNKILTQARQTEKLKHCILMSDGALIENSFITAVGDLARGMYFVGPGSTVTTRSKKLAEAYLKKFKEKPATSYYQSGYDAVELLLRAIEQTAVLRSDGLVSIGREALRRQLYQTKNFDGITGTLSCDQFGDCAYPVFHVLRLDNPQQGVEGLQKNVQYTFTPFMKRNAIGKEVQ